MQNGQQAIGLKPAVVITGGSEGIGLAIAHVFAAGGRHVCLVARRVDGLEQAAKELRAAYGECCTIASLDITGPNAGDDMLRAVTAAGLYADVLVNCAGAGVSGPFDTSEPNRIAATIALNATAATLLARAVMPGMLARRQGGILNVASLAGLIPAPQVAVYCATKSYLIALTRALAAETRGAGVVVSAVVPGPVATKFLERSLDAGGWFLGWTPSMSAEGVARVAVEGFLAGQTIVTPGLFNALARFGTKILPHRLLMAIFAPLLKRAFANDRAEARV